MSQPNLNEDLNIVANSNLEITLLDGDLNIIQALDDEPNDVGGLTSAELKAKFDEAGNTIKTYINGTLIPEILTEEATEAARAAAEAQREANETQRIENENARIAAEQARVDETNGIVAQATAQANAAAESAAQAKQIAIGDIPDGTLPESKLVEEARAAIDRAKVGGEIDTTLQKKVNPNLLDNWYFGNAVNQRGATGNITINRYFIDRWLYANGDSASSLTFNDGVVTLNGNNGYCALRQILEIAKSVFIGKAVTISALTTNMGLISHTFTCLDGVENYKNFSDTGSYIVFDTRADNVLFTFVAKMETISVIACKVEFGVQQTLAHQENGVWVLNEIPDYVEQLARCQRYYYKDTLGYPGMGATGVYDNQNRAMIHFPQTMRTIPSVSVTPVSGYTAPNALALSPNEVLLYTASDVNWGLQILEAIADLL